MKIGGLILANPCEIMLSKKIRCGDFLSEIRMRKEEFMKAIGKLMAGIMLSGVLACGAACTGGG